MDHEVRASYREALASPRSGLARLRHARVLTRHGHLAGARHELAAAAELGVSVPGELLDRLSFFGPDGRLWTHLESGVLDRSVVAADLSDARFPGALVWDEARVIPLALLRVVCLECDEGQVECFRCPARGEEPEDDEGEIECPRCQACWSCHGARRLPCGRCRGGAIRVDEVGHGEVPAACVHAFAVEPVPTPLGARWDLSRCIKCGLASVLVPRRGGLGGFDLRRVAACDACGLLGCDCAFGRRIRYRLEA